MKRGRGRAPPPPSQPTIPWPVRFPQPPTWYDYWVMHNTEAWCYKAAFKRESRARKAGKRVAVPVATQRVPIPHPPASEGPEEKHPEAPHMVLEEALLYVVADPHAPPPALAPTAAPTTPPPAPSAEAGPSRLPPAQMPSAEAGPSRPPTDPPPGSMYAELVAVQRGEDAATQLSLAPERERLGLDEGTLMVVEQTRGTRTRSGAGIGAPARSYVEGRYAEPPSDVEEEEEGEEDEEEDEAAPEEGEEAEEEADEEAEEEAAEEAGGEASEEEGGDGEVERGLGGEAPTE